MKKTRGLNDGQPKETKMSWCFSCRIRVRHQVIRLWCSRRSRVSRIMYRRLPAV